MHSQALGQEGPEEAAPAALRGLHHVPHAHFGQKASPERLDQHGPLADHQEEAPHQIEPPS